jgi:hypothetical protein
MAIKVPPGQSPPFETIDDKHHAGIIIITAAICLMISLVCLLIRVYVRIFLSPPWGSDDIVLLGATVRNREKLTCSVNEANGIDLRHRRVDHRLSCREHRLWDGHIATHREGR